MRNPDDYDYHLLVLGDPKAQKRHRTRHKDKKGKALPYVQSFDPSARIKNDLKRLVQAKAPEELLRCPLKVDILFCMARPKNHYGTGRNADILKNWAPVHHTSRPDIDNLRKLVMDALTGVFWHDDSYVCQGTTIKRYSAKPRTEIFITKLI